MIKYAVSAFGILMAAATLEAGEYGFKLGNAAKVLWDDNIWTNRDGTPYGSGTYPGAGDTIIWLDYDDAQGVGVPSLYLNGDRTIQRLETSDKDKGNARLMNGSPNSQVTNEENTLTITESLSMKTGALYFFSRTSGSKLTVTTPELVLGINNGQRALIQIGSSGSGNVSFTAGKTTLGGARPQFIISDGFDPINGYVNLGNVLFDMTATGNSAGINLGKSGATLRVASLSGGASNTRGTIEGKGTLLINSSFSNESLNQPANFNRLISDEIKVIKEGSSLQIFSFSNTYSGGTEIDEGVLAVRNATGSGLGTGDVKVRSQGILAGKGIVKLVSGKAVTVESGGIVAPGEDNRLLEAGGHEAFAVQRLTLDGTPLEMKRGSAFNFRVTVNGESDQILFQNYAENGLILEGGEIAINLKGTLDAGKTYVLFNFSDSNGARSSGLSGGLVAGEGFDGYAVTFHYDEIGFGGIGTISMSVQAIPEPNLSLLSFSLASGLLLWKRGHLK